MFHYEKVLKACDIVWRVHNRGFQIPPSRLFFLLNPAFPSVFMYESRSRPIILSWISFFEFWSRQYIRLTGLWHFRFRIYWGINQVSSGFLVLLASFAVENAISWKHIIVLYLQFLNTQNYIRFKTSAWNLFLKFRKFQARYSYKIYSGRKNECSKLYFLGEKFLGSS